MRTLAWIACIATASSTSVSATPPEACADQPLATLSLRYETSPAWGEDVGSHGKATVHQTGKGLLICVAVEADQINASRAPHDKSAIDDHVTLYIRPPQAQYAYEFKVNAAGATRDAIVSSTTLGNKRWTGRWTGSARQTTAGYVVSFIVPWRTIGMSGSAEVGLLVEQETTSGRKARYSSAPIDTRLPCFECQFPAITVEASQDEMKDKEAEVQWLPYTIGFSEERWDPFTGEAISETTNFDVGLDVSAKFRGGNTAALTINPDFSDIESDRFVSSINRRFAATYTEHRPFFTREAGVFQDPLGLVYTRAIRNPNVGVQVVRRTATSSRAFLLADDETTTYRELGSSSSYEVTMPTRSWNLVYRSIESREDGSSWGTFATARTTDGYTNVVAAMDGRWTSGAHSLMGEVVGTHSAVSLEAQNASATGYGGFISHRYAKGSYESVTSATSFSDEFRPDLSSGVRVGTQATSHASTWTVVQSQGPQYQFGISSDGTFDGSTLLDGEVGVSAGAGLTNGMTLTGSIGGMTSRVGGKLLDGKLALITVDGTIGPYLLVAGSMGIGSTPDYDVGVDGRAKQASLLLALQGFETVDASFSATHDSLRLPAGGGYTIRTVTFKAGLHPTEHQHIALLVNGARFDDYRDLTTPRTEPDDLVQYQFRYTYEPARFTRLILGVSSSGISGFGINGIAMTKRLIFSKIVVAF